MADVRRGPADLGDAVAVFDGLATSEPLLSDEVYILPGGDGPVDRVVKVRGGPLDIKRLEETDAYGLERWQPIFKTGFPLAPDDVAAALAALRLDAAATRWSDRGCGGARCRARVRLAGRPRRRRAQASDPGGIATTAVPPSSPRSPPAVDDLDRRCRVSGSGGRRDCGRPPRPVWLREPVLPARHHRRSSTTRPRGTPSSTSARTR